MRLSSTTLQLETKPDPKITSAVFFIAKSKKDTIKAHCSPLFVINMILLHASWDILSFLNYNKIDG